jgi:poly(beta-D-mannuronate) lyase
MKSLLFFSLLICTGAQAKVYTIHNAAELQSLQLQAGDTVKMADGVWKDQELVFRGNGRENKPIVLMAATPGKVNLQGRSFLRLEGSWLVATGLSFSHGYTVKNDVIVLADSSSHCRVTNMSVTDYSSPDKQTVNRWVNISGTYNRVDHCYFKGKTNGGPTLVVSRSTDAPDHHRIDHNYFDARPELGVNGGETMRIGTSHHSLSASYTLVEQNIFRHCNGELEIVSNKSCNNIIRYNLFYECKGTLTIRHGNRCELYGNYFVGNGVEHTGGIRIIGEDHYVHDNHMQDLSGTTLSAAISMMDGLPNPELVSHWQVKKARVEGNVIVNCKENFAIGAGKNDTRNLSPQGCSITGNLLQTQAAPVIWYDSSTQVKMAANKVDGNETPSLPNGFTRKKLGFQKDAKGIWRSKQHRLKEMDTDVGPEWMEGLKL